MGNVRECIEEMRCFVRGGLAGIQRLKLVYKNILKHYEITLVDEIYFIVKSLGVKHEVQRAMLVGCKKRRPEK